jgi:hypothetical protein
MDIAIKVNPRITPDQLFDFYTRNNICEVGFGKDLFGKDLAARVLGASALIVAAFDGDRLVGIARATFDGLTAAVMELSLDCALQGDGLLYRSGSLVEQDKSGIGRALGETFVAELLNLGATFIIGTIVPVEADFYRSIGFQENRGHLSIYIERRPYVTVD